MTPGAAGVAVEEAAADGENETGLRREYGAGVDVDVEAGVGAGVEAGAEAGVAAGVDADAGAGAGADAAALNAAEADVTVAVTAAEPVAGVEIDIEVHQAGGRLEAEDWYGLVEEAVSGAYKVNGVLVVPGEAAEAAAAVVAAADHSAELERMHRVRYRLMEGLLRRQREDCCGWYWELGKMQQD